jgi:hypothetical protein
MIRPCSNRPQNMRPCPMLDLEVCIKIEGDTARLILQFLLRYLVKISSSTANCEHDFCTVYLYL